MKLDIRLSHLINSAQLAGDEAPDIHLRPAFPWSNCDEESRDETLGIRLGELIRPAPDGGR